jgi:hypothetical protein
VPAAQNVAAGARVKTQVDAAARAGLDGYKGESGLEPQFLVLADLVFLEVLHV